MEILFGQLSAYEKTLAAILLILIITASIWIVQLVCFLYEKASKKETWTWLRWLMSILLSIALCMQAVYLWLQKCVPALPEAKDALLSEGYVSVHPLERGYFFDGWGNESAMIFYGEEKTDETAYAPLLAKCAAQGIDCFLLEMPYHRVSLDPQAAYDILSVYSYHRWYMGAHGSAAPYAVRFVNEYADAFEGVILFGAYPKETLAEGLSLIAIYAGEDGLFDGKGYETAKKNFPERCRESTITGGNHTGFLSCGLLKGDHEASITSELQQQLAAEMVRLALSGMNE